MELWQYCRAVGQTPKEALADPDLGFNLSVMRGSNAGRSMRVGLMFQSLSKDSFGIDHIINALKLLYEEQ
jgi:hypothetical protein